MPQVIGVNVVQRSSSRISNSSWFIDYHIGFAQNVCYLHLCYYAPLLFGIFSVLWR